VSDDGLRAERDPMHDSLRDVLARIRSAPPRVVVAGDAILDRWLRGDVTRVSREAPVPVVEVDEPELCAGGAANTAVNLAALGASVSLIATVGDDEDGRALDALLRRAGIDTTRVVVRDGACTASKTRVVGADQIVVRVDHLPKGEPPDVDRAALRRALSTVTADDVLVLCDYGTGCFDDDTVAWFATVRPVARTIVVDAHDGRRWAPMRPDLVTPNALEAGLLLGRPLGHGVDRADAVEAARDELLAASGSSAVVVTLDRDGTVALDPGRAPSRTRARSAPEHQASGAGDTFVAALATAVAVGAPLGVGAGFAQAAADVVTARPGTAVARLADVERELGASGGDPVGTRFLAASELVEALAARRAAGARVVFTNGCFDVIHRGHTTHLRQAKSLGDVLVVALNDDASVRRLKGPERPVNPLGDRIAVLEALDCIDYLTAFDEDTPIALLEALRPDVYAKGGDYTPEMLAETPVVRAAGGEVRILDYLPDHSTTRVVDRIRSVTATP